jgi:tryptophan halogenase
MIPTNERYGCGYVFDENHISADQAHAEIEQALGKKIDPIKQIHFESGRQQDLWIKNCVSIGLAAAFAEPLEATSIHTTLTQILDFIKNRLKDNLEETCDPKVIQDYNTFCGNVYDNMKEFLVAHYICGREDSDFWRNITAGNTITPFVKDIVELAKHRVPTKTMFPVFTGSAGWPLWCWVLSGTGTISPEVAKKELEIYNAEQYASEKFMENYNMHMHNALYLPKNDTFIRSLGMTI